MESFDVVIAGAGPAGLKCAETLGGSGLGVLVLERENAVGRKVCAGVSVDVEAGAVAEVTTSITRPTISSSISETASAPPNRSV